MPAGNVMCFLNVDTLDLIMQLGIQIVNDCVYVCDCSTIYNVDSI